MPERYVVDASVAAKWFNESLTDKIHGTNIRQKENRVHYQAHFENIINEPALIFTSFNEALFTIKSTS